MAPVRLGGLIALALALNGCLTMMVISELEEFDDQNVEFLRPESNEFVGPVQGAYSGTVLRDEILYKTYIFGGVLAGSGDRVLQVLIPIDENASRGMAIISDCNLWSEKLAPAGLLYCWDGDLSLFRHYSWSRKDPAYLSYIVDEYGLDRFVADSFGEHLIFVNFDNPQPVVVFISTDMEGGGPRWECRFVELDLDWGVRSRTECCLLYSALAVTVPLDIVTAPIQFLGALIFVSAGGAG